MQISIVIVALTVTLAKLKYFSYRYGLDVDTTKLWLHFAICMLLFTIFVVIFFLDWNICKVFWLD